MGFANKVISAQKVEFLLKKSLFTQNERFYMLIRVNGIVA